MGETYCPECDAVITMNAPQVGAVVHCPGCNVELEVVSIDPLDVYFPFDEDWHDDTWGADWDDAGD
jgi:alpha-aminoadipate carrier protein LysW